MTVANGDFIKSVLELVLADDTITQMIFHFLADFTDEQYDSAVLDAIEVYMEDFMDPVDARIPSGTSVGTCPCHIIEWNATEGIWETTRWLGNATPEITFTGAAHQLPNQIAAVLIANTPRPKSRGRKFIPGFDENSCNGSDIESAVLTELGTVLSHYLADENISAGNDLSPGVPRTGVNQFLEFTGGAVNSIVGTQRRRKPGIGA